MRATAVIQVWLRLETSLSKLKQEPLEYGILMEKRKAHTFPPPSTPLLFCYGKYPISFLNQISNAEVLMFGQHQNHSCHFHYLFHLFACLSQHNCGIPLKLKNCSDQPNMVYFLLKEGRKEDAILFQVLQVLYVQNR